MVWAALLGDPPSSFFWAHLTSFIVLASLLAVVAFAKPSDLAEISSIETFWGYRVFWASNPASTPPWHWLFPEYADKRREYSWDSSKHRALASSALNNNEGDMQSDEKAWWFTFGVEKPNQKTRRLFAVTS